MLERVLSRRDIPKAQSRTEPYGKGFNSDHCKVVHQFPHQSSSKAHDLTHG